MTLNELKDKLPKGYCWEIQKIRKPYVWLGHLNENKEKDFYIKRENIIGDFWTLFKKYKNCEVIDHFAWCSLYIIILDI